MFAMEQNPFQNSPNPYQSPPTPAPARSNMVGHVTIVAIFMLIQGGLECLMGALLSAMGPLMFTMMSQVQNQPGVQPPPKQMIGIMTGVYLVLGIAVLTAGILKIVAGIRNLKYRGKILGIVAMASSLVTVFTCYCAPTALGLLIYGLIVYLNADVSRAFAMGDQGMSADQIKASF